MTLRGECWAGIAGCPGWQMGKVLLLCTEERATHGSLVSRGPYPWAVRGSRTAAAGRALEGA